MTQLTDEQIDRTIDTCRQHLGEIAEALHTALGCEVRLSAGEARGIEAEDGLADFQVPGLAVAVAVGEQGLVLLIPPTLPLPAWYRQPDLSQNNRLQTLAHELSLHLLPADLQSSRYVALATENLIEVAQSAHATPTAKTVELSVFNADGTQEAAFAKILLVLPVQSPPIPAVGSTASADVARQTGAASSHAGEGDDHAALEAEQFEESHEEYADEEYADDYEAHSRTAAAEAALRALRILSVPVTVSVRLAERKMSLGTVMALVPGSLVTFNKSCEDLLDLYVNNHRYCQGEAIKIGESFGLKVSRVGVNEARHERTI